MLRDEKIYRFLKVLSILSFILFIISIFIVAKTSPAAGYELSIYNAYQWYFWFFLIGSICISIIILSFSSFFYPQKKIWIAGFVSLLFAYSLFLLLSLPRGYVLYGRGAGDILEHIGIAKEVVSTGYVPQTDIYPVLHILMAILNNIGVPYNYLSFLDAYFFSMFLLFVFLVVKSVSNHLGYALLAVIFASPLSLLDFHVSLHPSFLSILMIPLILYCYQKKIVQHDKISFSILLIILAFFIVFFHPVTTLILITIFIVFFITSHLYNLIMKNSSTIKFSGSIILFLLIVTFLIWYLSFRSISENITMIVQWVIGSSERTSIATLYTQNLSMSLYTPIQIISQFIKMYGAIFLQLCISLFCILLLFKDLLERKKVQFFEFSYGLQFLIGVAWAVIFIIIYLIEYEPERVIRYAYIMNGILAGFVIYNRINIQREKKSNKIKNIAIFFITLMVLISVILGILSVYASPLIGAPNRQLTNMECSGTKWFANNSNWKISVVATDYSLYKNEVFILGLTGQKIVNYQLTRNIPNHFGYPGNHTVSESLGNKDLYMITTKINEIANLAVPQNARIAYLQYTETDFKVLGNDHTCIKIYDNSEYKIWNIYRN